DQNRFAGSDAELAALCTGGTPAPPVNPVSSSPGTTPPWPGTFFVFPQTPAVSGDGVAQWQKRMGDLGFKIDTDGVYGPQSKAACMAFQRTHGLSADGIVGRATWDACFAS